jgi:hypothetical protein
MSFACQSGLIVPNNAPFRTPHVHISAGQSWRTNCFQSLTENGINCQPQTLLGVGLSSGNYPSGVLPPSAGINLPSGLQSRVRGYTADMLFRYPNNNGTDVGNAATTGRVAVLSQQLLRVAAGVKNLTPIIEYCMAVPSSTWVTGIDNGLGPGTYPWDTAMAAVNAAIIAALPDSNLRLNAAKFRSVGWTQGGSFDTSNPQPTIDEWNAMTAAYDALNLPGTSTIPLLFYIGIRAPNSFDTDITNSVVGSWRMVRANANGRTVGTSPWYQWPFGANGAPDIIHIDNYGTIRNGEFEGLAKYIKEDEGVFFKPLWRSLTAPIVVAGQTITIPFDRAAGSFFTSSPLAWMSEANDGIKVWPNYGFNVKRSGSYLTLSTPQISGMNVSFTVSETLSAGNSLDVSYAAHGPGGPNPGTCSGVGGNLMMAGPQSPLFPGKTINSWAWPFLETLTI